MVNLNNYNKLSIFLFLILPFSLIFSSAISTIIVSILSLYGLFMYFNQKNINNNILNIVRFLLIWSFLIIISSFASKHIFLSLESSLFYFRFVFFAFFIYCFLSFVKNSYSLFGYFLILTILILLLDSSLQYFSYYNLFGNKSPSDIQITSFFGYKRVLGSYLSRMSPLLLIVSIMTYKKNNFLFYSSVFVLSYSFFGVIISGERSSLAYYLILIFSIVLIFNFSKILKLLFFFTIIISFLLIMSFDSGLKKRIIDVSLSQLYKNSTLDLSQSVYFPLFQTSLILFKEKPIIGIGPKNFREECKNVNIKKGCSTHTHNIYIQLLSETGILGFMSFVSMYLYLFIVFLKLAFKSLVISNLTRNELVKVVCLLAILLNFFPFLPHGNFFGSWLSILFYLPLGFYFHTLRSKIDSI
jgi:O-antigen ligase